MKIQCDVCGKDEASVYCSADEAALCDSCDYQVHHANKLASKHYRFNLVGIDGKECPNCDVCQDKRAFLFCQQDRAILCRDCDDSIHSANEHTRKHDRFLLTGVKLSAKAGLYASRSENSLTGGCDRVPDFKSQSSSSKKALAGCQSVQKSVSYASAAGKSGSNDSNESASDFGLTGSSISEYLMETLPGWRVEDLLDSSSAPNGFAKQYNNDVHFPLSDEVDLLGQNDLIGSFFPDNSTTWPSLVPSVSPSFPQVPHFPSYPQFTTKQSTNTKGTNSNVKLLMDDGFTVPQIISPQSSVGLKRSRLI